MADKFSKKPEYVKGSVGIEQWMIRNVTNKPSLDKGSTIACSLLDGTKKILSLNRVGILFQNCRFMREGGAGNWGRGGSNCVTGDPVMFVDLMSVFPPVFRGIKTGILAQIKGSAYCLPLCQIGEFPDMEIMMTEGYTEFVAQKKGDNKHDITHIANGISSGLAAICFTLSQEINVSSARQAKPNAERMTFLVEGLHALALTAHSSAKFSPKIKKIFTLLPHVAGTADTLQSILMGFIFDELACKQIRVKQVGASILRYFKHEGRRTSFALTNPTGLISLLLVAPMLADLINTDLETEEVINAIISAINEAIISIVKEFKKEADVHEQNKQILCGFARATKVPLVPVELVDKIYDAVLRGEQDVAAAIGVIHDIQFVQHNAVHRINGKPTRNFAVLTKTDDYKEDDITEATYIPSDPREWTGLSLAPKGPVKKDHHMVMGAEYAIMCTSLGPSDFVLGNTQGQDNVANFRFTMGSDLMKGPYKGYSASGMIYDPNAAKKFVQSRVPIDPNGSFIIRSTAEGMTVMQNARKVFQVSNQGDPSVGPLFAFKYCTVKITFVRYIAPALAEAGGPPVAAGPIKQCLSLGESLAALQLASTRKSGKSVWGKASAAALQEQ